jgi:UDP-2-acetamido-3-amino-2,3-dideoxy-glucuronate N-acetyltransferase
MNQHTPTDLKTVHDERGSLTVAETGDGLPFTVERFFVVHGVSAGTTRGFHAHKCCHQFLIVTSGSVEVLLDDGTERKSVRLDRLGQGLHIPPGVWGEQTYLTDDTVLMVLASHKYDRADYISDYSEFLAFAKGSA